MAAGSVARSVYVRISLVIAGCTLLLTFSFVGLLAIASGATDAVSTRLPWYLVVGALAFVATIVLLELYGATGREIIVTASFTGAWALVLVGLSVEGVRYTVTHPEEVFVSRLVLYFLAAGLLGTGIAYWALHHWREFTTQSSGRL